MRKKICTRKFYYLTLQFFTCPAIHIFIKETLTWLNNVLETATPGVNFHRFLPGPLQQLPTLSLTSELTHFTLSSTLVPRQS